jgi:hypothetical protein
MEQCDFCSNIFGDKKMLRRHQKNTQYCLKIQETKKKEQAECDAKAIIEANKAKERKETEEVAAKEKAKELTCNFCGKEFKTKYLLNIHQTQTKYCLKIQESQNSEKIISSLIKCKFCDKEFSSSTFKRHDLSCKKKIQFLLNEKDQENVKLKVEKAEEICLIYKNLAESSKSTAERAQSTIEEIAMKPTHQKFSTKNIQNNIIANLTPLDLSQNRVAFAIAEKYTKNDFYQGQKGVAQIVHKHLLTDTSGKSQIICTDAKQGAFHHKSLDGEQVVDYENAHLIKSVHDPIKKKAGEIAAVEITKNPMLIGEIRKNTFSISELDSKPGVFNKRMSQLTGKNCARSFLELTSIPTLKVEEIFPITQEWLLENVKFFNIEHILKGPDGYADYFATYVLKDRVLVLDYSDAFIRFKDFSGELIDDYGVVILTKLIFDSLRVKNKELIMEYCTCLNNNFADNGAEIVQLLNYRVAVEKCADGNYIGDEDGDFRTEFIGCLLSKI